MKSNKRILKVIAKKYKQDPDDLLIMLWYLKGSKFDYLKNEYSVVRQSDLKFVEEAIDAKYKKENIKTESTKSELPKLVYLDYEFSSIGKNVNSISYVTREEILKIHQELVTDFSGFEDPISPAGVKNEHLLDSALFHPQTAFEGRMKYSTVESAGAALMYSISNNHAFHNGNKRTAIVVLLVFLDRHNRCLICSDDDLFKISIEVADHKLVDSRYHMGDAEIYELARWIHKNSKVMKKEERLITLKKLRQILTHFQCQLLDNGKVQRVVKSKFLGLSINRKLVSKKLISNTISDGDEVDKALIKSLREDLELDVEHRIDSEAFYAMGEYTSSEFITRYKNLLRRLSKI